MYNSSKMCRTSKMMGRSHCLPQNVVTCSRSISDNSRMGGQEQAIDLRKCISINDRALSNLGASTKVGECTNCFKMSIHGFMPVGWKHSALASTHQDADTHFKSTTRGWQEPASMTEV